MSIYVQLVLLAVIIVYGVDVSGFTDSWKAGLARIVGRPEWAIRPLPPFDCGLCATFWGCLLWALVQGQLSLLTAAEACALSLLSLPLGSFLVFIRELLAYIIDKITPQR